MSDSALSRAGCGDRQGIINHDKNKPARAGEKGCCVMNKLPLSLIIDDPAPRVFVYYEHAVKRETADGRPLLSEVPNSFLRDFCEVVHRRGLRGKFSVVPMPGGRGDIVHGIPGFPKGEVDEWLDIVREQVARSFSICPEMLTHAKTVDLENGGFLPMNEDKWAATQTAETLTPYIARAFSLLREAGLPATGVTSPWAFGIEVEPEYVKAISAAYEQVFGGRECWYFLRGLRNVPNARPWVALNENGRAVVSVPATTRDHIWQTMDTTDTSPEYISSVADEIITADGSTGEMIEVMKNGGWPILIAHWQSLFSNGLGTGLKVLDEAAGRIEKCLSDRVQWMSAEEIMRLVLEDPARYPMPEFKK